MPSASPDPVSSELLRTTQGQRLRSVTKGSLPAPNTAFLVGDADCGEVLIG